MNVEVRAKISVLLFISYFYDDSHSVMLFISQYINLTRPLQ